MTFRPASTTMRHLFAHPLPGTSMIAIVDYKAGNLTSVQLAFRALGVRSRRHLRSPRHPLCRARRVPGRRRRRIGHAEPRRAAPVDALKQVAARGTPFLGICLGTQDPAGALGRGRRHADPRHPAGPVCRASSPPTAGTKSLRSAGTRCASCGRTPCWRASRTAASSISSTASIRRRPIRPWPSAPPITRA